MTMSNNDDDDRMKEAFRELRASDAKRAPAMDALLQRKRNPGRKGVHALFVVVPSFAVLASAAAIVLWLQTSADDADAPAAANAPALAASFAAPTTTQNFETEPLGFLLETTPHASGGVPDFDSDPRGPR